MGAQRKSYPRFKRGDDTPRIELTDDDIAILRYVHRYRFVRADDLYRLFGERSQDKLSRRLTRLYRNQFLDRPVAQVDRFREGGSQALVYGLDTAGARFLKETLNVPTGSTDWKARNRSYTRENLEHTLLISRFMIDLELGVRGHEGTEIIPVEEIMQNAPEQTRRQPQPGRWPVELQWYGARAEVHIIPDAIFGLRSIGADGRVTRTFVFLEIDRGTMTIAPARKVRESDGFLYRATILRKLLVYAESYRQALHTAHLGIPVARVLFLTTSASRAEAMRVAAEQFVIAPQKITPGLFLFGGIPVINPLDAEFMNANGVPTRLIR